MTAIRGVDVFCDICDRSLRTCELSFTDARRKARELGWRYDRNKSPTDTCYDCRPETIPRVEADRVRSAELAASVDLELRRPRAWGASIASVVAEAMG